MAGKDALKLISLNIELDRHFDRVLPFLRKENPDMVCLQEVRERDIAIFKKELQMEGHFVPGCIPDVERIGEDTLVINENLMKEGPEGIAVFTELPILSSRSDYYHGNSKEVPRWSVGQNRILLSVTAEKGEKTYTIGTTHFTWTPDGKSSSEQEGDMKKLLELLASFSDIVFCGDFNAPRGGEMWRELAKNYQDNIPATYRSSLDPLLHRAGRFERMVDGLFSTPEYFVSDVRLVEGLSDHRAVVGMVERVNQN